MMKHDDDILGDLWVHYTTIVTVRSYCSTVHQHNDDEHNDGENDDDSLTAASQCVRH